MTAKIVKTKQYFLMYWYACFNNGYSISSPIKWAIGLFGLSSLDVKHTMIFYSIYILLCFFLGWLMFKFRYFEAMQEVANQYNPFVKEIRKRRKI